MREECKKKRKSSYTFVHQQYIYIYIPSDQSMRVAVSGNLVPLLASFCGGRDEEELAAACVAAARGGSDASEVAGIGEGEHRDLSVSLKLYVGSAAELPGGVAAALRAVLGALRLEYADVVLLDSADLHEPGEG